MTNMRRGFTMIELIFVIVIIGILAAVAIPKLAGTANEARKATVKGFLGTLNRSVGPTMWAEVAAGTGSVKLKKLADYTDIPDGLILADAAGALGGCQTVGEELTPFVPAVYEGGLDADGNGIGPVITDSIPATYSVGYGIVGTFNGLPNPETLYCADGTVIASPKFAFSIEGAQDLQNN